MFFVDARYDIDAVELEGKTGVATCGDHKLQWI